jgi:hypothetical protein
MLALLVGFFLVSVPSLLAREKKELEIVLSAQRVVNDANGVESLTDAADAKPGDIVQYTAVFLNACDKDLRRIEPVLPIPDGMEYIGSSAKPAASEASLDGRRFAPVPLVAERRIERGVELIAELPQRAYRALRWQAVDLAPGESITVKARVVVVPMP